MRGNLLAYEFTPVPFAIILGEAHSNREEKELEHNVIAKFLPEYILVEPSMGAWIFDPNKNQARLRDDEPLDCPEDLERMQSFLRLDINQNDSEPQEAFQSFQSYTDTNIFLDETDFKLWSIKYKIPLVGCDLCTNEKNRLKRLYNVLRQESDIIYNRLREEKMGEIISKYAKKSPMPIIVIIGHKHAAPTSRIHDILKQEQVGYLILTDS